MSFPRFFRTVALSLSLILVPLAAIAETTKNTDAKPTIQIAILLDSSNSMDGLIDQTRKQIWDVVNALSDVRKDGKIPTLEVALYHYGNDSLPYEEGFNRQLTDFTTELDGVSEELFTINTNGGQEYTGWVIESAVKELSWDRNKNDFRAIFIAGNEPFDQGEVPWNEAMALATKSDILVNTIYCGSAENPERNLWSDGAKLAKGANFNIDQDHEVIVQESPYDDQIRQLNERLNSTYIPYGEDGTRGAQRQVEQDTNAGAAIVTRGGSKSSAYYRNSSWDLVDAINDNTVSLATLDDAELPPALQGLSLDKKKAYIEVNQAERATIQSDIKTLTAKREEYIRRLPTDQDPKDTLNYAMIQALRTQLAKKGFILK